MAKKIAVLVTNEVEDSEYTEPVKAYKEAGHEIVNIEMEAGKMVKGKHGTEIHIDKGIDDVSVDDFDALLIPGGFSPPAPRRRSLCPICKTIYGSEKTGVCNLPLPQLLITAKALEGRAATGYKSIRVDMEYAGANFRDEEVVVCQNQLVTSRTPDDIPAFNRESLKILNG